MEKLNLKSLRVKSFVTIVNGEKSKTAKGGCSLELICNSGNNLCPHCHEDQSKKLCN